jgi:hypothetical protein
MKLTYTSRDGRMVAEFDADTQTDLFEQLAAFQEVFEDNTCVAKMKGNVVTSDLTRFVVRENKDGDKFYEKSCSDWDKNLVGFKKSFGCRKKGGGLFPKDMPEADRIPGLNGWYKYHKEGNNTNNTSEKKEEGAPF